jgi:purine-binding chemotaxis protein CheW
MADSRNTSFISNLANSIGNQETKLVVFELNGELYGVEVDHVQSIILPQIITPVPRAQEYVEGMTNLRGKVVPVINLARRLGLPPKTQDRKTRIIIGEHPEQAIGMVVDNVLSVTAIPSTSIEPVSPIVATVDENYVKGVASFAERLLIILDVENILNRTVPSPTLDEEFTA